jgi:DNA polymerase IV
MTALEQRASPTILHLDLDSFFVSVERLRNPALVGKPVLVGGRPDERGVVASASYEARQYGCRSAMPMARALRLCPHAVVVPSSHGIYGEMSRRVMALLGDVTPLVEKVSVDEAYLDVAGCELRFGDGPQIAHMLQARIRETFDLPSSLGVATNKLIAKIASGDAKPQGIRVVAPGHEAVYLAPRPVGDIPGVGPVTAEKLQRWGIVTAGDLAALERSTLVREFGAKQGESLWLKARGISHSPVEPVQPTKSISHENTFARDVTERAVLERELLDQAEHVANRLRAKELHGRTVTLKLRYADFRTVTRALTLTTPTDLARPIYEAALALLHREWHPGLSVRLIGVGISGLTEQVGYQMDLFSGEPDPRESRLAETLDELRERFGKDVIKRARLL